MKYSSMNLSLNQILFEFCMHEILNLIWTDEPNVVKSAYSVSINESLVSLKSTMKHIKLVAMNQYKSAHIDVKDVIVFVAIQMKQYYDDKHQSHFFSIEDIVNLHLHCDYILSSLISQNRKLKQQFVNSLCITEWIKKLVYQLDLSSTWKIHNVISIAYLEPTYTNDSYHWSCSEHSDVIIILSDTALKWELKCLLWKWTYQKRHRFITEYLAWWTEYSSEFDSWVNIKDLENMRNLVNKFDKKNMVNKEAVLS